MAKAKKTSNNGPSLAKNRKKRRARKNPAPSSSSALANPPIASDIVHVILPGFAAYAATRVLSRIVYAIVQKRWPTLGKHASVLASLASFGSMWFFAHKIKTLARYHDPILMGSGIAAGQSIVATYLPVKYSWLLTDARPEDVAPAQPKVVAQPVSVAELSPSGVVDEYTAMEIAAEQKLNRPRPRASGSQPPIVGDHETVELAPDLQGVLDQGETADDLFTGGFAGGFGGGGFGN
jgi:hypothetical protein